MRRAIEESKRSLEQEQARQRRNNKECVFLFDVQLACSWQTHAHDVLRCFCRETELEMALRISREEEANRNKALEDANSRALFDDQNQLYVSISSSSTVMCHSNLTCPLP